MPKHITKELKQDVINFYKQHPITIQEVANKFNLSAPSIIHILKEYKQKAYSKVQLFSPDLNESYFETIDCEEKAYFLGLIITDGCVYTKGKKQHLVSITLQDNDAYLIKKFKEEIRSNKKVTSDGRGCSEINILSNSMVNSLQKYGVTPNKSLHTIFPKNIDKQWYPALIRGIIDGDGSIAFYSRPNRKVHSKAIRLCQGNKQFLEDLMNFLAQELDIKPVFICQEKENLWSFAYKNNKSLEKLIHYLYDDATIYMIRKKELCDKIMTELQSYGNTEITK